MNDILFEILRMVVVVAIILLTRYVVPYLKTKIEESKNKWLLAWVETAVKSAQQSIDDTGEEKKAIVTKFLKEMLIQKNISISDEQLSNLIEAAVFAMKEGAGE
jgi:LL-H family phage holin